MSSLQIWTRRQLLLRTAALLATGWLASCKHAAVIAPESDGEDNDDSGGGDEGGGNEDGGGGGAGGDGQ